VCRWKSSGHSPGDRRFPEEPRTQDRRLNRHPEAESCCKRVMHQWVVTIINEAIARIGTISPSRCVHRSARCRDIAAIDPLALHVPCQVAAEQGEVNWYVETAQGVACNAGGTRRHGEARRLRGLGAVDVGERSDGLVAVRS